MNYFFCFIIFLVPLVFSYPRSGSNDDNHLFGTYLKGRLEESDEDINENSNEERLVRRQNLLSLFPVQHYQSQYQPTCLPHIWTCGPGLPQCCPGLMCFDGNAKRGRYCAARG
ncbi:unnamed protein product [Rotaria socialis]|uniref:Uncharacterized protein n=1 Tax=Rotaria socialis TaxID=392032 RepID=A0A817UMF2_9BILA|nr:unnamed protein product [Rotaria socialis]CAF3362613.1 unnamed protein product [Rotaria socialis]CAF3469133.1 unnamed protein product [Rotaria socialis]CAF3722368.1 unnamed protein product [Rotaria socialis]CAF4248469.1 unnamed protein product [Rotaria socialis]